VTVRIGPYEFDEVSYDRDADVLYLHRGPREPSFDTVASPEGHAVNLDEAGRVIGLTIVNAKWLTERDGTLTITVPERIEADAADLAPALSG
jgi:uncharacterized protein YuzE